LYVLPKFGYESSTYSDNAVGAFFLALLAVGILQNFCRI
jgi:hypothetical protein